MDELVSWTDAQIELEIARHVPEGLDFVCEWLDDRWSARLERVENGLPELVHAVENVDRRMALYNLYGYLWLKDQPPPARGSIWDASMSRPTRASVSQYVQSKISDPEDLDPEEVSAVYGVAPSKKKDV